MILRACSKAVLDRDGDNASVKAWCRVNSNDTQKFEEANSTSTDGLAIKVREAESQHFASALFQRGEYAMHELVHVSERHPCRLDKL